MSDWIEHDGKGMPVEGNSFVSVRFYDGCIDGEPYWKAKNWYENWFWDTAQNCSANIVAYKVVK